MDKELVTVKTFSFPADIAVVQSFLEMEGIEVFVKNMTTHRLVGPICDIEMQVRPEDCEKAKKALIEGGFSTPEDFES